MGLSTWTRPNSVFVLSWDDLVGKVVEGFYVDINPLKTHPSFRLLRQGSSNPHQNYSSVFRPPLPSPRYQDKNFEHISSRKQQICAVISFSAETKSAMLVSIVGHDWTKGRFSGFHMTIEAEVDSDPIGRTRSRFKVGRPRVRSPRRGGVGAGSDEDGPVTTAQPPSTEGREVLVFPPPKSFPKRRSTFPDGPINLPYRFGTKYSTYLYLI